MRGIVKGVEALDARWRCDRRRADGLQDGKVRQRTTPLLAWQSATGRGDFADGGQRRAVERM